VQSSVNAGRREIRNEGQERVIKGLRQFILTHKRFPTHHELLKSVNDVYTTNYTENWLTVIVADKESGAKGHEGLVKLANDYGIYEAIILDDRLYTTYPHEVPGVASSNTPNLIQQKGP
jgi:anionic cell wall polymer biosynthesis LytR-Cps2A-Psr (LCP) family protein